MGAGYSVAWLLGVKNEKQHSEKIRTKQGSPADGPEPYKIAASTPYDFGAKNLTPYGGHADSPIMPDRAE